MTNIVYIDRDENCLAHHGVKGQKWGVRRYQNSDGSLKKGTTYRAYNSTSPRAVIARRQNRKVDDSFNRWSQGASNRDRAIELGKRKNELKFSGDKKAYRAANKDYKKALRKNTTYRKGTVRKEVEADLSRKYLSKANSVKKQMDRGKGTENSRKEYNKYMSEHDVHRAKSRRAQEVAYNRSVAKANIKRALTITMTSAAIGAAVYAGSEILSYHNIDLDVSKAYDYVKAGSKLFRYV